MVFGELVFILKSPPTPLFQRWELVGVLYIILSVFWLPTYGVTDGNPVNVLLAYWWMRSAYPHYITIALRHRRDRSRLVPTVIDLMLSVIALKLSHLCVWSKTALVV